MSENQKQANQNTIKVDRLISELAHREYWQNDKFRKNSWTKAEKYNECKKLLYKVGFRYQYSTFESFDLTNAESGNEDPKKVEAIKKLKAAVGPLSGISDGSNMLTGNPIELTPPPNIVLFGPPGTGKDHLMLACAWEEILHNSSSIEWIDGINFSEQYRSLIRENESSDRFINQFLEPDILMISDPIPPKGDQSQYVTSGLQMIIDDRYRNLKSTWVTINARDGKEASEKLAAPLIDRLRHHGICIQCEWPSYRTVMDKKLVDYGIGCVEDFEKGNS
jgi:DNA replication protein DnaC